MSMNKYEDLKKSVSQCHTDIEAEKKELKEFKSKLETYIAILENEEEVHSNLQRRLKELAVKHEKEKTFLSSERHKVERFLVEQETDRNKLNSIKVTVKVTSIHEATKLTDATENIIKTTQNKKLAEENRISDFKQLDESIETRQLTELEINEIKIITDSHEVEKKVRKLKVSEKDAVSISPRILIKELAEQSKLITDLVPSWMQMVNIGHWLVCLAVCWLNGGSAGLAWATFLLLLIMAVHNANKCMVATVSGELVQEIGVYLSFLAHLFPILVVSISMLGLNLIQLLLCLLWYIVFTITARWAWREELSRLGLLDAAAWALILLPIGATGFGLVIEAIWG